MLCIPEVISPTCQEFQGVRYYLCGRYFQRDGVRLHRVVWEAANGMLVPKGFDVHHKDRFRWNNRSDNLQLLPKADHHRLHGKCPMTRAQKTARQRNVKHALAGNKKISVEDRANAAREGWRDAKEITIKCDGCQREFKTRKVFKKDCYRACGNACQQRLHRRRVREAKAAAKAPK